MLTPFSMKFVVPSVYVTLKVPGVGKVKVSVALPPEQIADVPLMLAIGSGFTVTTALPVMLALGAVTKQEVATLLTLTMV